MHIYMYIHICMCIHIYVYTYICMYKLYYSKCIHTIVIILIKFFVLINHKILLQYPFFLYHLVLIYNDASGIVRTYLV